MAWAQLVSTTDVATEAVSIETDKFTIGRAPSCDLTLAGNKLVSGTHCFIERDDKHNVWFHDVSTNGTLINSNKKVIKAKIQLEHGDEISIVFKKSQTDSNITYVFQDLVQLAKEELDCTLEYSSEPDHVQAEIPTAQERQKRKREVDHSEERNESSTKIKKTEATESSAEEKPSKNTLASVENNTKTVDKPDSEVKQCESPQPADSSKEKCSTTEKTPITKTDSFEQSLICIICQEIMHDCISLQPCMHSFCAGCYSDWMARSHECPSCRLKVDRINKNHIVNNLIEAFLKHHPEKKRSEDDLKELNSRNKITRDMLYPDMKKSNSSCSTGSESIGSSVPDSSDSNSDDGGVTLHPPTTRIPVFGYGLIPTTTPFGTTYAGTARPVTVCRQCKAYTGPYPGHAGYNYRKNLHNSGNDGSKAIPSASGVSDKAVPSTSAASTSKDGEPSTAPSVNLPQPVAFTCNYATTHILCNCCLQPMPLHGNDKLPDNTPTPPTQCTICIRAYCHLYWGCMKPGCDGCIGKLKDIYFGPRVLNNIILDNTFESGIFTKYIESKGLTLTEVFLQCLEKCDRKQYTCTDQIRSTVTSEQIVCYTCALRIFKEFAYQWRNDVPRNELPPEVTSRPDCYWGKNCRTAKNKPHHALRFNHICDQTKNA